MGSSLGRYTRRMHRRWRRGQMPAPIGMRKYAERAFPEQPIECGRTASSGVRVLLGLEGGYRQIRPRAEPRHHRMRLQECGFDHLASFRTFLHFWNPSQKSLRKMPTEPLHDGTQASAAGVITPWNQSDLVQ